MTTRIQPLTAADGTEFSGHLALPIGGSGPGVLLLHEIWGVNQYVRSVADRLADIGYVALAPDIFFRQGHDVTFDASDDDALAAGRDRATTWFADAGTGFADLEASLDALRDIPEVTGGVGVLGFCFGGTLAFRCAATMDPDAAVSYYGSGVPDMAGLIDSISCPTLVHFGGADPFIPRNAVDAFADAVGSNERITVHVHEEGGHAFDNSFSDRFSQPAVASTAWSTTTEFLATNLAVPMPGDPR